MKFIKGDQLDYIAAGHEDTKNPGVWKKVLFTRDDLPIGKIQMLNWCRLPPKSSFNPHYHQGMVEVFINFQGTAKITVDSKDMDFILGDSILIYSDQVHTMTNVGKKDVLYLAMGIVVSEGGKTVVVK